MSIADFMTRQCVQTAVYWGNPVDDGYGKNTYDDPVELTPPDNGVRWVQKIQLLRDWEGKGETFECIGFVYVLQELDKDGCLFLGTLDDLDSADYDNPLDNPAVFRIRQFEKVPALRSTDIFVYKAYLSQWQYR